MIRNHLAESPAKLGASGLPTGGWPRPLTVGLGTLATSGLVAGCLPGAATAESRDVATLYGGFLLAAAIVAIIVYGLATFAIVQ